jgi:hypothetical protein
MVGVQTAFFEQLFDVLAATESIASTSGRHRE